jgi:hypothetical protein
MDIYYPRNEAVEIIAEGCRIGYQKGLEACGAVSKYLSQNKAYALFKCTRVRGWVRDGLIQPKYSGNGRSSTIYYEHARLLELDASDRIVIRKGYVPEKRI